MNDITGASRSSLDRRLPGDFSATRGGPAIFPPVSHGEPWRRTTIGAARVPWAGNDVDNSGAGLRASAPPAEAVASAPQPAPPPALRVLVVDDDPTLRSVVSRMLTVAGFAVSCAPDGEAAWSALGEREFDVLVTDHDMPRLTGLDLLRRLRANRRDLPVLFVSGRMPSDDADLARLLPPGETLAKPFSMTALLTSLRAVLPAMPPGAAHDGGNGSTPRRLSAHDRAPPQTESAIPLRATAALAAYPVLPSASSQVAP